MCSSAYRSFMSERLARPPAEEESDWSPIRADEQVVNALTWRLWADAARSASNAGVLWGTVTALAMGGIAAGVGLLILLPSTAALSVLIYSPLIGWAGWGVVSARVRRRRFGLAAAQMKDFMVPDLVRSPWIDELHRLAATGHANFVSDTIVCRVEERLDGYAIQVFEYSPDRLGGWTGDSGGAFAGGGGDGGGGC